MLFNFFTKFIYCGSSLLALYILLKAKRRINFNIKYKKNKEEVEVNVILGEKIKETGKPLPVSFEKNNQ